MAEAHWRSGSAKHPVSSADWMDSTFAFTVTNWDRNGRPDIAAIKKSGTGTGSTEVHVLTG